MTTGDWRACHQACHGACALRCVCAAQGAGALLCLLFAGCFKRGVCCAVPYFACVRALLLSGGLVHCRGPLLVRCSSAVSRARPLFCIYIICVSVDHSTPREQYREKNKSSYINPAPAQFSTAVPMGVPDPHRNARKL